MIQLADAEIKEADLRSASAIAADFSGASLVLADFECADVRLANFKRARLTDAIFYGAHADNTDFEGAIDAATTDFRYVTGRPRNLDCQEPCCACTRGMKVDRKAKGTYDCSRTLIRPPSPGLPPSYPASPSSISPPPKPR